MSNQRKALSFVLGQFALLALLVLAPRSESPYGSASGVVSFVGVTLIIVAVVAVLLSFSGLRRSLTASPIPKSDGQLVTTGLYRYVRHPIYSAILLAALGVVLDAGYWPQLPIALLLYLLLNQKASFEEELLLAQYPQYAKYQRSTPRFFPRFYR